MADYLTITKGPVLAFDVALQSCGVCVYDAGAGAVMGRSLERMVRGQSEALIPMVDTVMAGAGVGYGVLTRVVTTIGPGGFTGLRIGLSTALALGMALDIPVSGVLVTEAIATAILKQNNRLDCNLVVVIETKRDDFYVHEFNSEGRPVTDCSIMSFSDLSANYSGRDVAWCGDGMARFEARIPEWPQGWSVVSREDVPDPAVMAALAMDPACCHPPAPLYLRGADVTVSTKPKRVLGG
jgi:tRNA threonylcarbamoyladenosine biosynthesis protein TsaB